MFSLGFAAWLGQEWLNNNVIAFRIASAKIDILYVPKKYYINSFR